MKSEQIPVRLFITSQMLHGDFVGSRALRRLLPHTKNKIAFKCWIWGSSVYVPLVS
jgi:hypothetical protein